MFKIYRELWELLYDGSNDSNLENKKDKFLYILEKIKDEPGVNAQGKLAIDLMAPGVSTHLPNITEEIIDSIKMVLKLDKIVEKSSKGITIEDKSISTTSMQDNGTNSKKDHHEKLRTLHQTFRHDQYVCKKKEVAITIPVLEELDKKLSDEFKREDVASIIIKQYEKIERGISDATGNIYARNYIDFFIDDEQSVIEKDTSKSILIEKRVYCRVKGMRLASCLVPITGPIPRSMSKDMSKDNPGSKPEKEEPKDEKPEEPVEPKNGQNKIANGNFCPIYTGNSMLIRYIFYWAQKNNTNLVKPRVMFLNKFDMGLKEFSRNELINGCNNMVEEGIAKQIDANTYKIISDK